MVKKWVFGAISSVLLATLLGCGHSQAKITTPSMPPTHWITYHPAQNLLTLTVMAGYPNGGMNLNESAYGTQKVFIPKNLKVIVYFGNEDHHRHSLALIDTRTDTPLYPGAGTPWRDLGWGLSYHQRGYFRFTAKTLGHYRLASLVPNDLSHGLWISILVQPHGVPRITDGLAAHRNSMTHQFTAWRVHYRSHSSRTLIK